MLHPTSSPPRNKPTRSVPYGNGVPPPNLSLCDLILLHDCAASLGDPAGRILGPRLRAQNRSLAATVRPGETFLVIIIIL